QTLETHLDPSLCQTDVVVQNKDRLFQRFVKTLTKKHKNISSDLLLDRLERRERQSPTSVGGGVAIPHAFIPGIESPAVGAFLLKRAVPFGPTDEDRVRTVFFLVGKDGNPEHHLPILARIARLCSTPEFLQVLAKARTSREAYKTVVSWDKRIGA
ncbi:MAG: PTS sugar transporter subunit IIA, partial [Candidatus Krumholzibacteria bacterium]|nr:PTS sugar transporter subunit IIA [Candidatus Krumholzibacteria bacterium]